MLDVLLVMSCWIALLSYAIGEQKNSKVSNITFMRLLRISRLIRNARIVRAFRFFRELRNMVYAMMACMVSLAWSFVFLLLIMFMFSALFVQAAAHYIREQDFDADIKLQFSVWYGSMYDSMFSLLVSILGGTDWLTIMNPLVQMSEGYKLAFSFYIVFVVVGVLNILTAVFLDNASSFKDLDLIVSTEIRRMDDFVSEMLELFKQFDPQHTGKVSLENFSTYIGDEGVQAYLASHLLDVTHADMLFRLLDTGHGDIDVHDFILGLLRLKGFAKEVDARVLLHEVKVLKHGMEEALRQLQSITPASDAPHIADVKQ